MELHRYSRASAANAFVIACRNACHIALTHCGNEPAPAQHACFGLNKGVHTGQNGLPTSHDADRKESSPHNPFAPPQAKVTDAGAKEPGSRIKALVLGGLVDVGGTTLVGIPVVIADGSLSGMSRAQVAAEALQTSTPIFWLLTVLGLFFSTLGGYVCARIAKRDELRLGLLQGSVLALFGFLVGSATHSVVVNLMFALLTLAFVVLGARIGQDRNRRTAVG